MRTMEYLPWHDLSDEEREIRDLKLEVARYKKMYEDSNALHIKVVKKLMDFLRNINRRIFSVSNEVSEVVVPGSSMREDRRMQEGSYQPPDEPRKVEPTFGGEFWKI